MVRSHSSRKDSAVCVLWDSIAFRDFYRGYKKVCVPFLSLYSSASREKIPPFCSAGICKVAVFKNLDGMTCKGNKAAPKPVTGACLSNQAIRDDWPKIVYSHAEHVLKREASKCFVIFFQVFFSFYLNGVSLYPFPDTFVMISAQTRKWSWNTNELKRELVSWIYNFD